MARRLAVLLLALAALGVAGCGGGETPAAGMESANTSAGKQHVLSNDEVNPLVADDSWTVRGERRRFYLHGGLLPEVGWVNRFRERGSMGLDGWVRVATSHYAADAAPSAGQCGSLRPPRIDMERVCAPSRNDASNMAPVLRR